ncbi:hypothetical protein HETIRDRAFT_107729 [Heterobasidion irregulare TC 32-1]|uniref:Uncharacterized protein n=1 Tax=Heterobasidion irregulare (strain TC 32-1) TaxID=747525 RepID=W4JX35_HETIT|nr:uncharacterized protein HETIRDRAFT_107729 [Heterobasidion irregulare TC 32-1]ETW78122.1 hypothetical protein HETIRDRAFT_107729 [Heterobasidion irregulare TC 32-1]
MTDDAASVHSRSTMDASLYEPNCDEPDGFSSVHQSHAQHLCDRRKLHPHASRHNIFSVWFLEIRVKDWRALPHRRGISSETSGKEAHPNAHPRPQPQDPCPAPPLPDPSAIAPPMPPLALEREQGRAALASRLRAKEKGSSLAVERPMIVPLAPETQARRATRREIKRDPACPASAPHPAPR